MRVPVERRGLPPGHVAVRLLLLVVVTAAAVTTLVMMIRAGVLGWTLHIVNVLWRTVRGWLLPW